MGNSKQYTDEFRAEAVKQVIERGFTVVDVASRIGIPKHTLYGWVQAAKKTVPAPGATVAPSDSAEIRRLKAELRRVTEERDILKNVRSQAIVEISLMAGSLYGVRVWLYFGPPCGAVALWAGSHIGASR